MFQPVYLTSPQRRKVVLRGTVMVAARLLRLARVGRYTLLATVVVPAGDGLERARFRSTAGASRSKRAGI
jgi:hypothetical protein